MYGTKELLFHLKAGEVVDGSGGYIEKGKIDIIIETVEPSKGSVQVSLEKEN